MNETAPAPTTVKPVARRSEVNLSGLSAQQLDVLDAVARMWPDGAAGKWYSNRYAVGEVAQSLGMNPADRSAGASLSRCLARLEDRGIIRRGHGRFAITAAGLPAVNELRGWHDLPLLPPVEDHPPLTAEEFDRRLAVMSDNMALIDAKEAVEHMSPAALDEFRAWLAARPVANEGEAEAGIGCAQR